MGHRKAELEKRIFVFFFIVTFFIVVILISIEWQLAKFGINQYEDVNIKYTLSNFTISLNEKNTTMQHLLHTLSSDPNMIKAIQSKSKSNIKKNLARFHDTQLINNLILYDKNRNLIIGEEWELIQEHFSDIFQYSSKEISSSFVANYGLKLYNINFCPVYSGSTIKVLHGIFIIPQKIEIGQFNLDSEYLLTFVSYKDALNETQVPKILKSHIPQINDIIEDVVNIKQQESINKLNLELATGIKVMYDLRNDPSGIFLVTYIRNVNRFAQQSLLFFILILLAVTLIMISTLGNWFSKTILIPVKNISNKMHDIAANPSIIEPIGEKYTGVLGDMVNTFNNMNIALKNHSRSLNEYKIITDNIGSGIFWLDNDFNVIVFNPRFPEILECTSEKDVINKNLNELLGLKEQLIEKVQDNSITLHQLEINIKNKKKFVILNIRAVKYQENFRFFGSITNITKEVKAIKAQEAMELELIKSNKLAEIGRKVEGIVHNLNSPLNSILGYAQLIKKDNKDNKDINKIIEAGKNMAHSVKGLLNKVKKSNVSMMSPIDINEIVAQELNLCKHNLFFKHYVILTKNLQKDLPEVKAVYGDISLCVANILNNAIEALKNSVDKNIKVRTYKIDDMSAIEVKDSGEGIAEENFKKIFETYFTTKVGKEGSGFGLGLAITKNIIERYNGKIIMSSKLGVGTTFTILLPVAE